MGEILQAVVAHGLVNLGGDDHFVSRAQQQGITVRCSANHSLRSNRAAGASLVFNHDALAKYLGELFAENTRGRIPTPPAREAHTNSSALVGLVVGFAGL